MKNVIIADDSALARMFIHRTLTVAGFINFTVREAKNGKDVIALSNELIPDLIITDLNMPELDGIGVTQALSVDEDFSKIPVIVITSAGSEHEKQLLRDLGVIAIISKPITPHSLSDAIGTILELEESVYE